MQLQFKSMTFCNFLLFKEDVARYRSQLNLKDRKNSETMKQIVILAAICLSLCSGLQKEKEKGKQLAMVLLKDCKNREGGSVQDIQTLMDEEIPTNTPGQCMLACVYEKLDVVSFFCIFLDLLMPDGFFNRLVQRLRLSSRKLPGACQSFDRQPRKENELHRTVR